MRQWMTWWGILATTWLIIGQDVQGDDWPRFRGPNGSGVSKDTEPTPDTWSPSENLQWLVELPGPGSSSPIVVGDKVFVTCWTGYGTPQDRDQEQQALRRHLICLDRHTGKILWDREVQPVLPEDEYGGMFAEHGYASHTPVSDGQHVYVFFGKTGALAFDMDGNQLWQTSVGTELDPHDWGSAASPILFEDLLIVTASAESEALVALDKKSGREVWRKEATMLNGVWGTPVLVSVHEERTDLVIAVVGEMWGFDPRTGKLRWYSETYPGNSSCSSAVTDGGVVYAMNSGPAGGGGIAIRAGGEGDVTGQQVVWSGRQPNQISTPIIHDGRIYTFTSRVVNCFDQATGKEIFKARLEAPAEEAPTSAEAESTPGRYGGRRRGGADYASPVLANGKIYFTTRGGDVYVLEAADRFHQLAVNRLNSEPEDFSATPAISDGQIFLRSNKRLYCVSYQ